MQNASKFWRCILSLFLCLPILAQSQQPVPYNKVQYHRYSWKVLYTPAFHVCYPRGYDSLASFASVQLPDIMQQVKKAMSVEARSIPNLIIYPSPDQLYESNIGMHDNQVTTFPTIQLKGDRVLLAFNGSYEAFRLQLTEAWVRLVWEEQFKNDAEEQLSNKKQLMPQWFKEGAIAYFASEWKVTDEAAMLQLLRENKKDDWEECTRSAPRLSGKAFCYFLSQRYREDAAKQVLFQLRKGKTLGRAVRLITKRRLDTLSQQCTDYYRQRLEATPPADNNNDTLKTVLESRFKGKLFALQYSPGKEKVSFIIERDNKRTIYISDLHALQDSKKKLKPFTRYLMPPWLDDHREDHYPLMVWEENGRSLYLLMPDKGMLRIKQYDAQGQYRDMRTLYGVDGADALSHWDAQRWILSAFRRGSSDIVVYDAQKLRYTTLTADTADHTQLSLVKGPETMLLYRSGYPADSLYHRDTLTRPYGIYIKKIEEPLKRTATARDRLLLADSAYSTWLKPNALPGGQYEVSGTYTGAVRQDTFSLQGRNNIVFPTTATPWLKDYLAGKRKRDSIAALLADIKAKDEPSVLKNILAPGATADAARMQRDSLRKAMAYTGKKTRPYLLQLYSTYFSAQINNDYYINRYQPFQAYLGSFRFPEVGAMVQGGFSDLFENHHFNIGYRMPAGTEGSDFFVRYENTARKLDWHVLFFRKVESLEPDAERDWTDNKGNPYPAAAKVKTHYYELGFHYPLHYDWSLDFTTAARRDRTIFLATDRYSLNYEALQSWWSMNSLSLQVRKLHPTLPFLYQGWEAKAMLDGMLSTGKQSTILYGTQLKLALHQPLIKGITAVLQAQGGYSGGQSRILYNFGGLDNNMVPRTDTSVRFPQQAGFAFQSLITPFRGYRQNSIYGGSFALLNADVYFPLFATLIPLQTGFSAVNNLQLGLFSDMAATGQANGLPPITTPLYSFGFSARTMLAGYPLRFDMAWPGTLHKSPVWYLSLNL